MERPKLILISIFLIDERRKCILHIKYIYTKRRFEIWPSWQCVYEWEDIFKEILNLKLINRSKMKNKLFRYIFNSKTKLTPYFFETNAKVNSLVFMMRGCTEMREFSFKKSNFVPILIDVWEDDLESTKRVCKKLKMFYVISKEIYDILSKEMSNVKFMPLSIADFWKRETIPEKKIDVLQPGRRDAKLHSYMLRIVKKYPDIEYVYQLYVNGQLLYNSTKKGILGNYQSRKDYMDLLSKAKISLVSAPGTDSTKSTGGINPVTARFYDCAVNYCYLVGRFPNNADFKFCELEKVFYNIKNYSDFESIIFKLLNYQFDQKAKYDEFINKHLTSERVKQLNYDLEIIS